ncbi:MAG: SEC-C metal-binding domain-containing protein [Eubacteriales bacterium]|jgi:uncharacterized protein YecA (UPF0149 family)|nr:SEC-C metal-binding domain-containing protein [Eubacteriales bacterium]MDD3197518.1 SEC-C metal-binding domain-containing protein [Eubacteriales bacterium]MDD3502477.1 SEC-C metal-binding domain-containing protein [Eubacteriales bacterium]MDD4682154.1 SEC-C metal-binding domain-containing protein [Eubacteriales bacterium]
MSYFEEWQNRIEDTSNPEAYNDFVQKYYQLEQNAYDQVLQKGSAEISGVASEIAVELGFADDMVIFTGFLDGIQTSLKNTVDLASVADDTTIDLKIDFEKLYWNMHDAKAEWLYKLDSWQNVISEDRRTEIAKEYRESQIVRVEKIGRNDPCPCGSGKKYKQCCMKKQEART